MWTEQQDDTLAKLWNAGKSAAKVAAAMGVTRNAVIGRIHRLKAKGADVREHIREPGKRRVAVRVTGRPQERIIRLVKPCKPPAPLADTLEGSVPLGERTGCKWPVTAGPPHRFCNREPLEGKPYCEGHLVRAVQPREMRRGRHEVPFQ